MNLRNLLLGALALGVSFLSVGRAARADAVEIVVVVHKTNTLASINRSQLSALFKAKSTEFPGAGRASPVNLPPESPLRQAFDQAVLGMTPDEIERFWLDSKIRSGVGSPRKVSAPDAVIRFVGSDPTGLGYIAREDITNTTRIIARIRGGQVLPP